MKNYYLIDTGINYIMGITKPIDLVPYLIRYPRDRKRLTIHYKLITRRGADDA